MLTCTICDLSKTEDNFYPSKRHKSGYLLTCKSCEAFRKKTRQAQAYRKMRYGNNPEKFINSVKKYREANKEKISKRMKIYYLKNKEKRLQRGWKQKGILSRKTGKYFTREEYNQRVLECSGVCQICKSYPSTYKKGLVVDHNHETGFFRDVLCSYCNTAIAFLKEDPKILQSAIEYLKKHNKT